MKFLTVMVVVAACGGGGQSPVDGTGGDDDDGSIVDDGPVTCTPPSTAPRTIFLNRGGGTYTPGADNSSTNTSSIITQNTTLPPTTVVEAEWTMFVDCMKSKFAPFHVTITDVDPTTAVHIELVAIDNPQQIGQTTGLGGVSPFGCDAANGNAPKVIEQAIPYVVYGAFNAVKDRCEVGAQVVGNALGLDHEFSAPDIMSVLNSTAPKEFTNALVNCGEDTARNCMCGGTMQQSSFQYLLTTLGPSCN